jgi:hypothetical protein
VFIFLSDRVSEGSVYGGSVTVQASLPFKHVTDTTDTVVHRLIFILDHLTLYHSSRTALTSMVKFNWYAIFAVIIVFILVCIGV